VIFGDQMKINVYIRGIKVKDYLFNMKSELPSI